MFVQAGLILLIRGIFSISSEKKPLSDLAFWLTHLTLDFFPLCKTTYIIFLKKSHHFYLHINVDDHGVIFMVNVDDIICMFSLQQDSV